MNSYIVYVLTDFIGIPVNKAWPKMLVICRDKQFVVGTSSLDSGLAFMRSFFEVVLLLVVVLVRSRSDLYPCCYFILFFFLCSPTFLVEACCTVQSALQARLSCGSSTSTTMCACEGVSSSRPHDIDVEVKVKGCYLVRVCFQATYMCVFVPLGPHSSRPTLRPQLANEPALWSALSSK